MTAHPDRRRYRRIKAPIFIRPVGPLGAHLARQVNDISRGGLRAFSDEKRKTGERFEIELFLPDGESATVVAEVVWVQVLPEGSAARYDVGLRYVSASDGDLQRIAGVLGDE